MVSKEITELNELLDTLERINNRIEKEIASLKDCLEKLVQDR